MDKYFVYADTCSHLEELVFIGDALWSHRVSEILTHFYHIHLDQVFLQHSQQGYANAEDSPPTLHKEHVKDRWNNAVGEEAREDSHEPLGGEVVCCHLDIPKVREEIRHVEFD